MGFVYVTAAKINKSVQNKGEYIWNMRQSDILRTDDIVMR